jgi:hypothetical protein
MNVTQVIRNYLQASKPSAVNPRTQRERERTIASYVASAEVAAVATWPGAGHVALIVCHGQHWSLLTPGAEIVINVAPTESPVNDRLDIAQFGSLPEVVQTDVHVFSAPITGAPSTAAESWLQRIELRHARFPGVLRVDLHPLYNQDEAQAVSDAFRRARSRGA